MNKASHRPFFYNSLFRDYRAVLKTIKIFFSLLQFQACTLVHFKVGTQSAGLRLRKVL